MRRNALPVFLLSLALLVPAFSNAAVSPLKVIEMAVTTKMVRGNPIDSVHRISSASVKALYCFTRVTSDTGEETTITHSWYRDGQKLAEYKLPVKGKKWRTYSSKTVDKGSSGDWRVDALDSEGNVLRSVKFRMN